MLFFFFQAEDGIRDGRVTGVQTCALPISRGCACPSRMRASPMFSVDTRSRVSRNARSHSSIASQRSEERRVGKECSARWWSRYLKTNDILQSDTAECSAGTSHTCGTHYTY